MIRRSDIRLRICIVLTALNLIFIWGNSLLPANISAAISSFIRDVLAALFPGDPGEVPPPGTGHGLLRKIAHMLEFFSLGLLLSWLLAELRKKRILALPGGISVACIDEFIQFFVPGRGPGIRDVGIDTLGVITGIGVFTIIFALYKRKLRLKLEETKQ